MAEYLLKEPAVPAASQALEASLAARHSPSRPVLEAALAEAVGAVSRQQTPTRSSSKF